MHEQLEDVLAVIAGDLVDPERVEPNAHNGFDLHAADGRLVRLVEDDSQIRIVVFSDAQRMLPVHRIVFDWVPTGLVVLNVRAYMLASAGDGVA